MRRWLIDGMNLIGSRPTGWWRDRPRAMRELVDELEVYADVSGDEVTVVFDGAPFPIDPERVSVRFATRRGRDAADDEIARMVADDEAPAAVTVVTSDSRLADRVRSGGAEVESVTPFRRRLEKAGR
jgi:predicted RNA-binding protein with PIN domain